MKYNSKKAIDNLSYKIIGCCIEVHKYLGPGLLESVYHKCLIEEFRINGIAFNSELPINIEYKGKKLDTVLKADFFIEKCIVLEIKAVSELTSRDQAQTIGYMKLLKAPKSILINFNCTNIINEGSESFVSEFYAVLPKF